MGVKHLDVRKEWGENGSRRLAGMHHTCLQQSGKLRSPQQASYLPCMLICALSGHKITNHKRKVSTHFETFLFVFGAVLTLKS